MIWRVSKKAQILLLEEISVKVKEVKKDKKELEYIQFYKLLIKDIQFKVILYIS